ncbi:hypothetical protein RP20_CCG009421 [Aedes albopictus]|nr:hypothetical protein RP20_CCG009421 [Aedes albopictus]
MGVDIDLPDGGPAIRPPNFGGSFCRRGAFYLACADLARLCVAYKRREGEVRSGSCQSLLPKLPVSSASVEWFDKLNGYVNWPLEKRQTVAPW